MAVYNDPVDGSSSKRKANGHADAPAPKKANTQTFVPRNLGERYQGTAARQTPKSRTALEEKPAKQQNARDINLMDVDPRSSLRKGKTMQLQRHKDDTAMDLDVSSSMGRKRHADDDLHESAAKKQRLDAPPSSNMLLTQSSKAGKAGTKRVVSVKPAPKTNFFNSLYREDSKVKASAGVSSVCTVEYQRLTQIKRALVSTEYIPTAVPSTAVQMPDTKHTAATKAPSVTRNPNLPTPPKGSKQDGKGPVVKNTPAIKTSLNKESGKLPAPTPREGNSPKETTASGKGISKEKLQAPVDNESTSAQQTEKEAPMTKSDAKDTKDELEKPSVKVSSQTPPVSHLGNIYMKEGDKKSLKRKKEAVLEETTELKKRRKGDGSAAGVQADAPEDADPHFKEVPNHDDPNAKNGESARRGSKPRGIRNEAQACYMNSVLQAIANIPRMADHYRGMANKVIPEVEEFVALNAKNWTSRAEEGLKKLLKSKSSEL